ncbi:hypothetical protein [Bianquea renquensis]|uniref:Uncharacterized protein n=1 Tax=Bianquea renquensis TaxID=2763661 RepID=A0A926DUW4_9FIRM|nr:hypothetical protein [Bianquea renquensis]MBC8543809.1 hypothetical protein [Bianquea renquensis]
MLTILGLLAIYLDPIVGTVDIVPDAVGYGLISISLLVYNRKCSGGIRTVCLSAVGLFLSCLSYFPASSPGIALLLYILLPVAELLVVFSLLAVLMKQLPDEIRSGWLIRAKLVQLCQALLFLFSIFSVLFSAILVFQIGTILLQVACSIYILLTMYALMHVEAT